MTQWLINLFTWMNDFITGNFGLTIVLFTLLLRLICLPLDIYSRKGQRDYTRKMKLIQPEMDRITKAYKNNQEMLSRKTMELRRQHGIGLMPKGCFAPLIAYPLLIAFFAVFNSMAQAQNQLLIDNIKASLEGLRIDNVNAAGYLAVDGAAKLARGERSEMKPPPFFLIRGEDIYEPDNQKLLFPVTS